MHNDEYDGTSNDDDCKLITIIEYKRRSLYARTIRWL